MHRQRHVVIFVYSRNSPPRERQIAHFKNPPAPCSAFKWRFTLLKLPLIMKLNVAETRGELPRSLPNLPEDVTSLARGSALAKFHGKGTNHSSPSLGSSAVSSAKMKRRGGEKNRSIGSSLFAASFREVASPRCETSSRLFFVDKSRRSIFFFGYKDRQTGRQTDRQTRKQREREREISVVCFESAFSS